MRWVLELRRSHHRVGGEEILAYRAHVDVPALALRRLDARQITHRRKPGLQIGRDRADYKGALERIDCDLRIGYRTIARRHPVDMILEELALAIVGVDI